MMDLLLQGAAVLFGLVTLFIYGRHVGIQHQQSKTTKAAAEAAKKTNERMDNADVSTGDHDNDLDWLRERSKRANGAFTFGASGNGTRNKPSQ